MNPINKNPLADDLHVAIDHLMYQVIHFDHRPSMQESWMLALMAAKTLVCWEYFQHYDH